MKEPIPKIELELSDVANIKNLPDDELEMVPYDKKRLQCSVLGCNRFTNVKDYGISPEYYCFGQWHNLNEILFFCPKHWKIFKSYNRDHSIFEYKEGPALNHLI